MGFSDANYHFPQAENLSINSKTVSESDRPADQDILESIQAAYFSINEDFDICRFELEVCNNLFAYSGRTTVAISCRSYRKF